MISSLESALKAHLADVVPGVPVFGTFDEPDFEAAPIHVQVVWLGFSVTGQSARAAALQQVFAVRIGLSNSFTQPEIAAAARVCRRSGRVGRLFHAECLIG